MSINGPVRAGNQTPNFDDYGSIGARPETIFCSGNIESDRIPHEVLMVIVASKLAKIAKTTHCHVTGRLSPGNDEVPNDYKGRKFNILLCGEGTFYLLPGTNRPQLLKLKESDPSTGGLESRYFSPLLF